MPRFLFISSHGFSSYPAKVSLHVQPRFLFMFSHGFSSYPAKVSPNAKPRILFIQRLGFYSDHAWACVIHVKPNPIHTKLRLLSASGHINPRLLFIPRPTIIFMSSLYFCSFQVKTFIHSKASHTKSGLLFISNPDVFLFMSLVHSLY